MNDRKTKWTWDKFVVADPESKWRELAETEFDWRSIATKLGMPKLVEDEDEDAIRDLVSFPGAERLEILFYPTMGRVLVVVFGGELLITLDDLRRINRSTNWDVMIVSGNKFDTIVQDATQRFRSIENAPDGMPTTLVENGIFDFDDLSVADPVWLATQDGMDENLADKLIEFADQNAEL